MWLSFVGFGVFPVNRDRLWQKINATKSPRPDNYRELSMHEKVQKSKRHI